MSSNIFLIIAVVTTGIFVIQFILSIFFGDIDADVDVDADISSMVSFKGLTHFGIGFGWYMYLIGNTDIQSYVIAILIGLFFVFAVFCVFAIDGQWLIFLCTIPAYCPVTALMNAEALSVPIWKVKDLPEAIFTYR